MRALKHKRLGAGAILPMTMLPMIILLMTISAGSLSAAQFEVLESTVEGIKPGMVCRDGAIFDIPRGAKLTLIEDPGGKTHVMRGGPEGYKGSLAKYTPPCGWMRRAVGWCQDNRFGGTMGGARSPTGATRGLAKAQPCAMPGQ